MINEKDIKYFNRAKYIAELSTYTKHPFGCVVVYRNRIISTGFNSHKTSVLQKKYNRERNIPDWSIHKLHAETDALKNIMHLDIDWSKVKVYIYKKRFNQDYGLARPCPSCLKLITDLGIKNIYYTTDNGFAYEKLK